MRPIFSAAFVGERRGISFQYNQTAKAGKGRQPRASNPRASYVQSEEGLQFSQFHGSRIGNGRTMKIKKD